ncbi:5,10-methylenetetrahydrofolate reductase [Rosistilla oblonga]|uniref:Methylenetetrahydrofolate reductase n=2 Tax=Rosistilla TaxID=2795779 RepID=A0A518IZ46_9BACT|nr:MULTISPECIES: methylenetetrahydrofolate reductase [NAD(P)H] [Rosistilla]QDS89351.1 5,10-methylenetetrahydrofolate reductase [Rosistilla ulvae]QDV13448.1 5,10-methylenetetrahydrofolate reductase [Rosistilla oblonga]QDV58358.1 5,10-methylenetetrahydrofolate reductase [Rosistilla oblonga]
MSLSQLFRGGGCPISFELFPPRTPAGFESLYQHVDSLKQFDPAFFTCTYGAGGSTRDSTLDVVREVKRRTGKPVASHLTCVGSTQDQLRSYLTEAGTLGVDYIVALRGDPPKGETSFTAVEGGFRFANELVEMIHAEFPEFGIAVAGYPEVHQEAVDADVDMENLKRKVDAGADCVVTQLFYDNDDFFRFRDACQAAGIEIPIIPGLLPITNFAQAQRIASMCKAKLPQGLVDRFNENDSAEWQLKVGIEHAQQQTNDLIRRGIDGLHLYVLNKSQAAAEVLAGVDRG